MREDIRTLELGKHRRARIWIGKLPDTAYPCLNTLTLKIPASEESRKEKMVAAVELFVPLGARFMYGLLGGQLEPHTTRQLTVDISVSSANERPFDGALLVKDDDVRVGLPAEYAQAVLAGVESGTAEPNTVKAGKLSIDRAAHGAVGSCEVVFKHLAAILFKVLNTPGFEPSDEELLELFPGVYS